MHGCRTAGGYTVSGYRTISQAAFGRAADNFTTLADNYGKQISHWNGVDVSANARLANGIYIQGGTSTGRTSTDNCEILAALPEINPSNAPYCHQDTNWLTQVKGAASYTVPRIDVAVSGTFQFLPGTGHRCELGCTQLCDQSVTGPCARRRRRDADGEPGDARHLV